MNVPLRKNPGIWKRSAESYRALQPVVIGLRCVLSGKGKERASRRALLPENETFPLYGEPPPARLLPIARGNPNGVDARIADGSINKESVCSLFEASEGCRIGACAFANPGRRRCPLKSFDRKHLQVPLQRSRSSEEPGVTSRSMVSKPGAETRIVQAPSVTAGSE